MLTSSVYYEEGQDQGLEQVNIEFVLYKNKEAEIVDEDQSDSFLPSGIN